jgi:hypothetical protein
MMAAITAHNLTREISDAEFGPRIRHFGARRIIATWGP